MESSQCQKDRESFTVPSRSGDWPKEERAMIDGTVGSPPLRWVKDSAKLGKWHPTRMDMILSSTLDSHGGAQVVIPIQHRIFTSERVRAIENQFGLEWGKHEGRPPA